MVNIYLDCNCFAVLKFYHIFMIMNRMFSEMKFYSINFVHFFPQQGIRLISGLIDEYSLEVVQAYMAHIQVWDFSI